MLDSFVQKMHSLKHRSALRIAKHAILFVQILRPRLRKTLQASWSSLKSWEEQEPYSFRPPLPLALLAAMVCKSNLMGMQEDSAEQRRMWFTFTALILVSFFSLLRPGELLSLTAEQVVVPNTLTLGASFAVIRIAKPKNARQMGSQQYVELRHPDAVNWVSWLVNQAKTRSGRLWPLSAAKFRNMFQTVCEKLRVKQARFSPASLRAGGATWLLDSGMDVARIRFLGRWAHLRSLEHYLQVARAQQITLSINPSDSEAIKRFLSRHVFLLSLPQFLEAQVPGEHLLASKVFSSCRPIDVISTTRAWGELASTVQESRSSSRLPQRGKISGRGMGGPQESSQELQK